MACYGDRRLARYGMLILALVFAGLWICAGRWPAFGTTLAWTIAPGHEIVLNIWTPGPTYASSDLDHGSLYTPAGPLTVMIWHQNSRATSMTPLSTLHLPNWPLLASAVGLGFAAAWIWRRSWRPEPGGGSKVARWGWRPASTEARVKPVRPDFTERRVPDDTTLGCERQVTP